MIVYKIQGKEYTSLYTLRREHPELVFPDDASEELLSGIGIQTETRETPSEPQDPLQKAKMERYQKVQELTVEVDGMVFDANEVSQTRMARVILTGGPDTVLWVLHDNTVKDVTKKQLLDALNLAVLKTSELWVQPYK